MTSFFDKLTEKLNGKGKQAGGAAGGRRLLSDPAAEIQNEKEKESVAVELARERLDVDVYQSPSEVTIYALAAGVDLSKFDVILDEENDLLTIKGERKRPVRLKKGQTEKDLDGKYVTQECEWNSFVRKIILPMEVDIMKAEAVYKKGVLVVALPALKVAEGRHLKVTEALSGEAAEKTETP
ncbi:MAG: hypothetical protein A2945_01600 [Candidatus Liptonbacteria bacterium RIFCSPLOWO2_01_FULL_52_25]|uniref:SHSP domain-containing protein n=1 Tax=Candidatus Liptonbacteria bacterium RIFCSPLOWO2_01_FULL_52_25 TaxID=1798650 RepID=A0A1G2CDT3_9BACT|nr:MAG: hypothetical protein A2945_01600 [Candidatus Liptonbacteria bacterium RIFCSPLOWO2_01_FULL_52_25]